MAVASWPATLPQRFQVSGYGEGIADGRLRSTMDIGPAKVRRRSSAAPRPLSGTMMMRSAQIAIARAFVEDTLLDGSLPFMLPDPLTRQPIMVRIATDMPSWSGMGGDWFAWAMTLEVLPT